MPVCVTYCSGPHPNPDPCLSSGSGGSGGTVTCVDCGRPLNAILYATVTPNGEVIPLVWNGTDGWEGTGLLNCGQVLYLFFEALDCVLFFSCSGTNYFPGTSLFPTIDCGPPFTHSGFLCAIDDNATADCPANGCGTVVVSISE